MLVIRFFHIKLNSFLCWYFHLRIFCVLSQGRRKHTENKNISLFVFLFSQLIDMQQGWFEFLKQSIHTVLYRLVFSYVNKVICCWFISSGNSIIPVILLKLTQKWFQRSQKYSTKYYRKWNVRYYDIIFIHRIGNHCLALCTRLIQSLCTVHWTYHRIQREFFYFLKITLKTRNHNEFSHNSQSSKMSFTSTEWVCYCGLLIITLLSWHNFHREREQKNHTLHAHFFLSKMNEWFL